MKSGILWFWMVTFMMPVMFRAAVYFWLCTGVSSEKGLTSLATLAPFPFPWPCAWTEPSVAWRDGI